MHRARRIYPGGRIGHFCRCVGSVYGVRLRLSLSAWMRTRMVNKQRGTTLQAYRQHQLSKVQNYTLVYTLDDGQSESFYSNLRDPKSFPMTKINKRKISNRISNLHFSIPNHDKFYFSLTSITAQLKGGPTK